MGSGLVRRMLNNLFGYPLSPPPSRRARRKRKLRGRQRKRSRLRKILVGRDGEECMRCRHSFMRSALTIDHIIPRRDGGSDDPDNLQLLCEKCHREEDATLKGGAHPEKIDWR